MAARIEARYPIFVPSKGRADRPLTARVLARDGVSFKFVVEPQEVEAYAKEWGEERVLSLPENNRGLVYSRNWIKEYSIAAGDARHWQFDDDIKCFARLHHGRRFVCPANVALAVAEDFVDRYENVALASFNSWFFVDSIAGFSSGDWPPFYLNSRCYTNFLVLNSTPHRWRYRYNEDTDMTLQVLATGWCTILFNAFLIDTPTTMQAPGGQMVSPTGSYQEDGRLRMARELERVWPGVVETGRRFGRPQHRIKYNWRQFDTPLKPRPGFERPEGANEYGLVLREHKGVKNAELAKLVGKKRK